MSKSKNLSRDGFELIVEAAKALLDEPDLQRLIPRLLDLAFEVSGVERGYMLLRDSEGELSPVAQRGIEPGSLPEGDPSRVVVETALRERRPVLSTNAARDPRFTGSESIIIRGIRSTCCIPLETPGNRIGAFYLDAKGTGSLNEEQLPLLEAFGALAALSLARAMDLGGYYRVPADNRGLNYEDYFTEGEKRVSKIEDYHSHNTKRLTLGETKQLLLKLTLIQNDNIENLGIKDNQWQNQN